jgi:hypothetical protein
MPSEYLIQYGLSGFVGRFAGGFAAARGDRVVVRTPRGVEPGTVLCPADGRYAGAIDPAAGGDLLRPATAADLADDGRGVLAEAERLAGDLPLTFLDVEAMLDGPVVLHAVPWAACDADGLFAELSARFGRPVRLFDVSRTPTAADPPEKSCGSGCGSGGCSDGVCGTKAGGCSSGGCSRKAVKSADDLTAYFADLRTQMEAQAAGRTALN